MTRSRAFTFVTSSPLTLAVQGPGTIRPGNLAVQPLEVGRTYAVTAIPSAGCLFSNWVGTLAGLPATGAALRFVMESNAVLTANFVTNPFTSLKGNYYGLVYDLTNGINHASSGFFSGTIGGSGSLSAKLLLGGRSFTLTGQFDLGGHLAKAMPRAGADPLILDLLLASSTLTGTVSNSAWVSTLEAYRSVYSAAAAPCPNAGRYTFVLPTEAGDPATPEGSGYGLVTVDRSGLAILTGSLADGTAFSQSVPVSRDGDFPLYVSLYGGKGSLIAWVKFTMLPGLTNAPASWIKPASASARYYPAGFTNVFEIEGSSYGYVSTNRILDLTNGEVIFSGGKLAVPLTNAVLLTSTNRLLNQGTNPMSLALSLTNGYLSGWFKVPGFQQTHQFKGVLLPQQNRGEGYFLGTNQSGRVFLGQ